MDHYYKEGAWWVSPYNCEPEVVSEAVPIHPVEIHDATLRDGEQTPGVVFTEDEKVEIAGMLIEAGVTRIEAGMPAVSREDFNAIKRITTKYPQGKVYAFSRALKKDIDLAAEAGVTGVVIEVPIGYPKLQHQFHWTWETVLEKSVDCINYARSQGLKTVYFPYDTTRARLSDLENLMKGIMENSPPDSVGVVDTMGCALPQAIQFLVRKMKKLTGGLPVEVHTHNDFGMAVATELAGLAAGADVVHSCVNGLGERTGNASLEELALSLRILMGIDNGCDFIKMRALCERVADITGRPIPPNKPFAGERNYVRESGIGVDLVMKEPLAMFATDPRYFGQTGSIVLGKKSGKASIEYSLEEEGIEADQDQIAEILTQVKRKGTEKRGLLTRSEFTSIVNTVL
ncbi:MAG: LeuA family protein [Lachnospiraceae bacterium]